ncbi:MAG TPA: peptide deformylase [Thermodesulfobacteriota bacterium]
MAEILEIEELGNPILREKAKHVDNIGDEYIQNLIDNLTETVSAVNGVGIAAPQVNESYQIFIIYSHPNPRYPDAPKTEPLEVINPKIISRSDDMVKDWEGCLSIPGIRGLVPRHKSIAVEYTTRNEGKKREELEDFIARIFQHEYDHLNGIVFLDRLESVSDMITEKEYIKLFHEL